MKTYLISYSWPVVLGSYIVKAEDGISAGEKVSAILKARGYNLKDSNSMVIEIKNNNIEFL